MSDLESVTNLDSAPTTIPVRPADVPEKFWNSEQGAVRVDWEPAMVSSIPTQLTCTLYFSRLAGTISLNEMALAIVYRASMMPGGRLRLTFSTRTPDRAVVAAS